MPLRISKRHLLQAAASLISIANFPQARAQEVSVSLGTATPGGGFPVYGDAFVAALKATDPSLIIKAINTKGSAENIPLLEVGKLDIALVQGESAYEALNGIGRPAANLKIFSAMYSAPGMFVVRADSPYKKIGDLKGQAIAFGAAGSGLVILARYILDGIGLDQNKDFKPILLERAGDGPAMVQDGRVAALWGGGIGWPGFTTMANSSMGARFIAPTKEQIKAIQAKHSFLKPMTVPASVYKGQDQAIQSVGSWSFILARLDLDEAIAYRLAKALHAAESDLAKHLPQASETTARNTLNALPRADLLHSGVAKYFREIGLEIK